MVQKITGTNTFYLSVVKNTHPLFSYYNKTPDTAAGADKLRTEAVRLHIIEKEHKKSFKYDITA